MYLHKQGYTIIKKAVKVDTKSYDEIVRQSQKYGRSIFNDNAYHNKNDNNRRQNKLRINEKNEKLVKRFHTILKNKYKNLNINSTVVLHSRPGCREQAPHLDFEPDEIFVDGPNKTIPLNAILALEKGTTINVWPNSIKIASIKKSKKAKKAIPKKKIKRNIIKMKKGDIFVFRGDLVHAGSAYSTSNTRLHCFLDSPDVFRLDNRTYRVNNDEDLSKIIIQ